MIIGTCGFSGGRKAMDGSRTNVNTVPFSGQLREVARADPGVACRRRPAPVPAARPTVMLAAAGLTSGEEEIE